MSKNEFNSTFEYKLIYAFKIDDSDHMNMYKVGEATLHTDKKYDYFPPNCAELNYAAKQRINQYTVTAGIKYQLVYTEIAVFKEKQKDGSYKVKSFNDHKVHEVLRRSGIQNHYFDTEQKQNEWFVTDLGTIINAINAVKNGKDALTTAEITNNINPISFRPEQLLAIKQTINQFKINNHMLWNAKMRFGKTLTALEVVKELKFKKTIIITHRPAVDDGWFDDFKKIFYEKNTQYNYGSKNNGMSLKNLKATHKPFVYFASIQDLRGSIEVGGKYEKNDEVFDTLWDFVITDEAHEGTQTELGKKVRERLVNDHNKELSLSGTPFNLFDQYSNENTYTWDYIMEQKAKYEWINDPFKLGDHNPYEELPKLNLFTYHLEKLLPNFIDIEDKAFNFKEFFRTWTGDKDKDYEQIPNGKNIGDFVHEDAVNAFLNLLCEQNENTNYPFSTDKYQDYFRHTLWMIPGVKEGAALEKLLKKHSVFGSGAFNIVNVAGNPKKDISEELKQEKTALKKLRKAIGNNPEETYTITLSCGRLTTGVTVPEWTAVLMLAGSYSTDAKQYLQTIFRVQSPANINGKIKENCYVFDFAPDRTLKVVYDAVKKMSQRREPKIEVSNLMGAFLNFCPVISFDSSQMMEFKAEQLLQEIKRVYTERVVDSGFEDYRLYNDEQFKLDGIELEKFDRLQKIIGKTKQTKKPGEVVVADNDLTDEQRQELEDLEKKKKEKKKLSEEEKKRLAELKKKREQKRTAISILRGISIRIPLLVYGLDKDYDYDISIDNFADMVDEESWNEFMPNGVTKDIFKDFIKYYDKDIFVASCRRIRTISKDADDLEPTDRIKQIITLFNKFKNPDKETVLTPWNVVNLHMSETIGGYDFFDENHTKDKMLDEPRFVKNALITDEVISNKSNILEINSKTGLYPLYVAYSLYRKQLDCLQDKEKTFERKLKIWDHVISNNLYVICKTDMAKLITKRTLVGYRDKKINSHAFDDLIMQFKDKPEKFVQKISKPSFWKKGGNIDMKFNAVVGNPPYQGTNHQQIYPYFYLTSIMIGDNVSLIFPVGWQEPKNANNLAKLNTMSVKKDKQIVFIDNRQNVFPGITGAEWTNIILWKKDYDNGLDGKQLVYENGDNPEEIELPLEISHIEKPSEIVSLGKIVKEHAPFKSIIDIVSTNKPYGLRKNIIDNYDYYNLPKMYDKRVKEDDLRLFASNGRIMYCPNDYPLPKRSSSLSKYKVFIPSAWGNMSENSGLGGAYSDIIIGMPNDICTETFVECGPFDSFDEAKKFAKYALTNFVRALIYVNKVSQQSSRSVWENVPFQDFTESWWDKTISKIDDELVVKYGVPDNIKTFIKKRIQIKTESSIVNLNDSSIIYECKDNNSFATGYFDDISFIVCKGSRVSDHLAPSFEQYDKTNYNLRLEHENNGIIKDGSLVKDVSFTSQSAATAYVTGHIANGSEWIIKNK